MSHDDNGSYPHDCYPDRRKVADRRERDRADADRRLGLGRDRAGFEALARSVEPEHPAHGVAYFEVAFIRRPQRVTDAHRRDVLRLLSFGALTFRAICDRYDYEASIGHKVDRDLVRRTLRSLVDRGEVMAVKTRRPPQHLVGRKGKSKHERKPMTVYAVTAGAVALPGWAPGAPSRVTLEDHVLALLVVSADLSGTGRTVLTCSSEAQAARVMAEAKRMLSSPTWTRP